MSAERTSAAPRPAFSIRTTPGTWHISTACLSNARIWLRERTGIIGRSYHQARPPEHMTDTGLSANPMPRMKALRSYLLLSSAALVAILVALTAVRTASGQPHEGPPAVSGVAPQASAAPSAGPSAAPYPAAPIDRPPVRFEPPPAAEPGSQIVVTVLTFSPGEHPFFKFGHSAILIQDPVPPRDRRLRPWRNTVYNWGGFAFEDPAVIPKFFQGRFMYWLDIAPLEATIPEYRHAGRAIYAQELDLTPAEKLALEARLEENARPENLKYKYDYYRDNCATRVRDMIDGAADGRVK